MVGDLHLGSKVLTSMLKIYSTFGLPHYSLGQRMRSTFDGNYLAFMHRQKDLREQSSWYRPMLIFKALKSILEGSNPGSFRDCLADHGLALDYENV
mmetsp:Transcript_21497/g.45463  ORF Transcript_21497/g.45463 Transcript_21497/m.45463 type:complete len:96 (+) Transcript_21497:200-487(+)